MKIMVDLSWISQSEARHGASPRTNLWTTHKLWCQKHLLRNSILTDACHVMWSLYSDMNLGSQLWKSHSKRELAHRPLHHSRR